MIQPIPAGTRLGRRRAVAAMLAVAVIGSLWVPLYAHSTPRLGPFPFFYWFQFIWVPTSSALCWIAYLLLRTSPDRGDRAGPGR